MDTLARFSILVIAPRDEDRVPLLNALRPRDDAGPEADWGVDAFDNLDDAIERFRRARGSQANYSMVVLALHDPAEQSQTIDALRGGDDQVVLGVIAEHPKEDPHLADDRLFFFTYPPPPETIRRVTRMVFAKWHMERLRAGEWVQPVSDQYPKAPPSKPAPPPAEPIGARQWAGMQQVMDHLPMRVFWKDRNSTYQGCNRLFADFVGLDDPSDIVGRKDHNLPWPKMLADYFWQACRRVMESDAVEHHVVESFEQDDHTKIWLDTCKVPIHGETGQVIGCLCSFEDVTETHSKTENGDDTVFHDVVTGLSNRALFMNRLAHAIHRAKRDKGHLFAVLYLDIDRFRIINESLGPAKGDVLLKLVGARLVKCLRPTDTIARLTGDEFSMLLDEIRNISDATRVVQRVLESLKQPFVIDEREFVITASVGIAPNMVGYEKPEDVLSDANTAMNRAKRLGKARYEMYEKTLHVQAMHRLQLEQDLRAAVAKATFNNVYQPLVNLATGEITGFEALVRWRHPDRGPIFPDEFIPVAEETGLIVELGKIVLREACKQAVHWHRAFPDDKPISVSVNLSTRQFADRNLVQDVIDILQETGLDANYLKLEITESVLMQNVESVKQMFNQLKDLNIQLLIDDFGTGYSSLSYLHRFPMDVLKIDRSFVGNMHLSQENFEIVRTIVALAHTLNMTVVAEGIETADQLEQLKNLNCEFGQGYFFSKPLPPEEAEVLLAGGPVAKSEPGPRT